MGHAAVWNSHPKGYGKGSRACRVCGSRIGLIRKYSLDICRRCFRENANAIGFHKGAPSVGFAARTVSLRPRAMLVVRAARTGSVRTTALLHCCGPAPQQMADAADECGGTGAMAPPPLADATPDNTDDAPAATPAVAAAQVAAAAARELYLSIVHSALGRPATVHMVDGQARHVTSLVAVDISAGGGGNLAVRGLSTPLGVLPAATLRGDDVVAVDVELAAPITLPVARP